MCATLCGLGVVKDLRYCKSPRVRTRPALVLRFGVSIAPLRPDWSLEKMASAIHSGMFLASQNHRLSRSETRQWASPAQPPPPEVPAPAPAHGGDETEAEKNFKPTSIKFWMIMSGVYASIFLVALDRLIIATAIPSITNDFHSIADIGWYGSAYMLTAAIFFPLSGRLYQLCATKWAYIASIVVFEAGSALCGAAPSSAALIVGRAIAGMGSAGIFTGGIMIIVPLVPLHRRPVFTSFFGVAFGISSVLGPIIGGSFTDNP